MIEQQAEDLWTIDSEFRLFGVSLGTRTTLVRLADGGLWLCAPGPLNQALAWEISQLGPVRHIVAPNQMHYLYVNEAAETFSDAEIHLAPGLAEKIDGLPAGSVLGDEAPPAWKGELDQIATDGTKIQEVAFLHRASRTLILTDLAFNVQSADSAWTRLFMRINSGWKRFGPTRVLKSTIDDKPALRKSLDRILEWDFDRVVVTHGEVLQSGGRDALRSSYAWLS